MLRRSRCSRSLAIKRYGKSWYSPGAGGSAGGISSPPGGCAKPCIHETTPMMNTDTNAHVMVNSFQVKPNRALARSVNEPAAPPRPNEAAASAPNPWRTELQGRKGVNKPGGLGGMRARLEGDAGCSPEQGRKVMPR